MGPLWTTLFNTCNNYAAANQDKCRTNRGTPISFKSVQQVKEFVACTFAMGLVQLPAIRDHYSHEDEFLFKFDLYDLHIITRNRTLL